MRGHKFSGFFLSVVSNSHAYRRFCVVVVLSKVYCGFSLWLVSFFVFQLVELVSKLCDSDKKKPPVVLRLFRPNIVLHPELRQIFSRSRASLHGGSVQRRPVTGSIFFSFDGSRA